MAGLSRDAAHANQTLSPIFDKEKEQNRLATAQKIGEIGRQVSDVLVTQGKLNAQAAQSDPAARAAARAKLVAGGNGSPSEEQISAQVSRTATADYDTGGKYQKVAQAVTAAMQGLAGGNLAQAASGAVSPYVAEIIHSQTTDSATGKVNVEANAMAHAVWGAIAAASGNNSALAGAAGAVSGELLGRWIAAEYYPDVKTEELSDEQKSTISALSTLAAGLMGGLSGGSSADAVAGAEAGKNAVENNLMGGNEWSQGEKAREHGADVLSCADNPSGEACQRGIAENKAYAGALASAGLIYLPGGMQITGAIGGTANAGIQYLMNGEVNPTDVLIATYVGAFTANTGAWGTVGWNAAGGATSSYLNGDDPFKGGVISGAASGIGYGIGKVAKISLDKWVNPAWKNYEWVNLEMGISKPLPLSPIPGISGNAISSIITEATGQGGSKTTNNLWKRTENEK